MYPLNPDPKVVYARWVVTNKSDILKLIAIFNKNNFNTTKHLDYLAWREAFLLYFTVERIPGANLLIQSIDSLKSSMNESRINFVLPKDHQVKITPYWLLGFSEGEACFGVVKTDCSQVFAIDQTSRQNYLMKYIALFLLNLITDSSPTATLLRNKANLMSIGDYPARGTRKPITRISIRNFKFIVDYFIPFLNSLTFFSQKELDFKKWQIVARLRVQHKHLTPEGKYLIGQLCGRMNKNRLSTNKMLSGVEDLLDLEALELRLKALLDKPVSGVWVYDHQLSNSLIVGSPFPNITQACKALGIGPRSAYLDSGKLVNKRYLFSTSPTLDPKKGSK